MSLPYSFLSDATQPVTTQPVAPNTQATRALLDMFELENTPAAELTSAARKAGKQALSRGAPEGPELHRILSLPTRDWRTAYDVPALVEQYTKEFRFDGKFDPTLDARGVPKASLLPMQAIALHELRTHGRLYVVAGLGTGKTLLSGLYPTLLGRSPAETLYLEPAKLANEARTALNKLYIDGWRVTIPRNLATFEEFSLDTADELLARLAPKCFVIDESQGFGNAKSGRARRLASYLQGTVTRDQSSPNVITLTATPGDSSLRTVLHLMQWTLGEAHMPLPSDTSEAWIWCQCLDADTGFDKATKRSRKRPPPGALVSLLASGEEATLDNVRHAVGRRIENTPGVFYYRIDEVTASLEVREARFAGHSAALRDEFAAARSGDTLADGRVLDVPVLDSVLFQTLGLGFARVIDPPPPVAWRDARKEYNSLVREVLNDESYGLYTPGQVGLRFASGALTDPGAWRRWRELEPTFTPQRKSVWLDDGALRFVEQYLANADGPTIVWCAFPTFARRLAERTGLPFFHARGLAADGTSIQSYVPAGTGHVIASIQANATGRNLQDRWSRNLVIGCPAKADLLQQLIGRTHRRGQLADVVTVDVLMTSVENALAIYKARERATVDRSLGRALESRLLDCGWSVASLGAYVQPGDPVWSSNGARLSYEVDEFDE